VEYSHQQTRQTAAFRAESAILAPVCPMDRQTRWRNQLRDLPAAAYRP